MRLLRIPLILSLMLLSEHAWAGEDDDNSDRKVVYKQKTEIDFEDLEVEATLQKPQSALILERKKASFNPLVKIRTEWSDEIERSTEEVK